jgi:hypothetical protein
MTMDERLEKLLERREALTQSVELIASMQQDVERESKKTTQEIRKLARLVRVIVLDHESRPVALEGEDEEGGNEESAGKK